jgi:hypothetical protein
MLITANITERDSADPAPWDALEIQRSPAPAEDEHQVAPCADQPYGAVGNEELVLLDAWTDEDLILGAAALRASTRSLISMGIPCIDDERSAAGRIRRRFVQHKPFRVR